MRSARLPALACVTIAGSIIWVERAVGSVPAGVRPVALAALVAAAFLPGRVRAVAVLGAAVLFGAAGGAHLAGRGHWPEGVSPTGSAVLDGFAADDADAFGFSTSCLVEVDTLNGQPFDRRMLVRAGGRAALELAQLRRGDRVQVRATVRLTGDDLWARRVGAIAIGDDAEVLALDPPRAPHLVLGGALRDRVERGLRPLAKSDRGLVLGFLLGDTSGLDPNTRERFRSAGLSHLLAVSGANVAFVLALAGPLLRRIGYRARFGLGVGVVAVFAAATRFEPSVLRASAMALVVMLARLAGRSVSPGRALALSVFVLLVHDPSLVHATGFRLSVAATAGIVAWSGALFHRLRGPVALRDALAVTLAAQVAVAPLLVIEFGSLPAVAVLTNLLAVPATEPLTVYGLLASVAAPSLPGALAGVLLAPCAWLATWVRAVAGVGAAVPLALDGRALGVAAIVGSLALIGRQRHRHRHAASA